MKEKSASDKVSALVCETNPISHRIALVSDKGSEVFLFVTPRSGRLDFTESCLAFLYLHPRPLGARGELDRQKCLREMSFPVPPVIGLLWDETGQCVAALVNGEPWASVTPVAREGSARVPLAWPRATLGTSGSSPKRSNDEPKGVA